MTRPSASWNWYEPGASGIDAGLGAGDHAPIVAPGARRPGDSPGSESAERRMRRVRPPMTNLRDRRHGAGIRRIRRESHASTHMSVMVTARRPGIRRTYRAPRPTTPRWATGLSPPADDGAYPLRGGPTCCDSRLRCRTLHPRDRRRARRPDRRRQGDARRPAPDPRPPLPARRGHPLGRRPRRLVQARPVRRGQRPAPTDIVFCGVHFMAESADVLTGDHQRVILPDLNAGCSMADMADIDQVEEAWEAIGDGHRHRPGRARSPT